jgi:hypothetical protein
MAKANRPPKPPKPGTGGGGSNTIPAPTGLTATMTFSGVYLQWTPVTNAQGYWIYRNGYVPAIVQATNYTDLSGRVGDVYEVAAVVNTVLGQKSSSVTA